MRIIWEFDPEDIAKVKTFFNQHADNPFVQARISTNLKAHKSPITKEIFWKKIVECLLTTQQRSGPGSSVIRFISTSPFPLEYKVCAEQDNLAEFAKTILSDFGGLRRSTTIGKELAANMSYINAEGWNATVQHLDKVRLNSTPDTEKNAAAFIIKNYKGFGPKQSRNLLQVLGISQHEIPIDSRITKWLNTMGFPVKLTANALQDQNYYNFVSDGFQKLCEACDIIPCVLDAAIFSSYDKGKWTGENVVQ